MAWPPTIPPNDRTNATPTVDAHASDHNAIANALTAMLPTAWTAIPLGPNYQAMAGQQVPQYRREGDVVRTRGRFQRTSGNLTNGDVFGTLPVGFRPPSGIELIMSANGQPCCVSLGADGTIVASFPPANVTTLSLYVGFGVVVP